MRSQARMRMCVVQVSVLSEGGAGRSPSPAVNPAVSAGPSASSLLQLPHGHSETRTGTVAYAAPLRGLDAVRNSCLGLVSRWRAHREGRSEARQQVASQALPVDTGAAGHPHSTHSLCPHASPAESPVGRHRGDHSQQASPNPPFMPVAARSELRQSENAPTAHFLFSSPAGEAREGGVQGGSLSALSPVTPGMLSVNKSW